MSQSNRCSNCNATLGGGYCADCGQKDIDLERPVTQLAGEVLKETFEIDGRAYRTLQTLFLQPGVLTREFLAGRRKTFTPPLRLYLVISVSFFVLVAWLAAKGVLLDPDQSLDIDAASQAQFMSDELPRLMFILMPAFAILMKLAFWRRLYFDHLIYSIHLHSAAFVVLALMMPLEQVASEHWIPLVAQILLLTYFVAYFTVSLHRVYHPGWPLAVLKSFVILLVYMVIVSVMIESTSDFLILAD